MLTLPFVSTRGTFSLPIKQLKMKKLLLLITLICITVVGNSQKACFIGGGPGISSRKAIAFEVAGGLELNKFLVQYSMLTPLNNIVEDQTAFTLRTGYRWIVADETDIELTVGAAYNLRSTDLPYLNTFSPAASVVYVKSLGLVRNQVTQFYTGIHFIEKAVVVTAGLRLYIFKQCE